VQTNGLTLCRKIAESLPERYATVIGDGTTLGEALLAPSTLYVAFVAECQKRGIKLNYAAHVTGHGWRKLMRLEEPFVYEITAAPAPGPALFSFLMKAGPVAPARPMPPSTWVSASPSTWRRAAEAAALEAARVSGYDAWFAGTVRKDGNRKAVSIPAPWGWNSRATPCRSDNCKRPCLLRGNGKWVADWEIPRRFANWRCKCYVGNESVGPFNTQGKPSETCQKRP
jgi:hypothetical protein